MTRLERLGLEVVAYTLIGSRASAAVLMALIEANGRVLDWKAIDEARAWKMRNEPSGQRNAVKTRVCLLRNALADLGLPDAIRTELPVRRGDEDLSYALPEPARSQIINRLIEESA